MFLDDPDELQCYNNLPKSECQNCPNGGICDALLADQRERENSFGGCLARNAEWVCQLYHRTSGRCGSVEECGLRQEAYETAHMSPSEYVHYMTRRWLDGPPLKESLIALGEIWKSH